MSRRPQDKTDWLALVSLVCFIAGTLLATSASLSNRQFGLAVFLLALAGGLVLLAERRGRALDRAILSMLVAGAVSLVLGFALLRILVTYSMNESPSRAGVDSAADSRSTATAALTETQGPLVTASPEVSAVATPEPAAAASCGEATVSGVSSLNIRAEPNISSPVLGNRAAGNVVELLCDAPVVVNGIPWRRVRSGDIQGWMSERYLQVSPAPGG